MIARIVPCLVLLGVLTGATPSSALTVFADADGDTVHDPSIFVPPGASFTLSFFAEVDATHGGLTSYGVELGYGEPPLGVGSVADIVSDAQFDLPETVTVALGSVEAFDADLFASFVGTVHLFDATFDAQSPGTTTLQISNIFPGNPSFDGFVGFDGFVYDESVVFLSSEVIVTPEPVSLALLCAGLGGLACFRRWSGPQQGEKGPTNHSNS